MTAGGETAGGAPRLTPDLDLGPETETGAETEVSRGVLGGLRMFELAAVLGGLEGKP